MSRTRTSPGCGAWARRSPSRRSRTGRGAPKSCARTPDSRFRRWNSVVEHKFDGLTINLTYESGRLVGAATRGNGVVGEEILPQAMTIRTIPLSIPFQGRMEVHGEAFMRISALEAYNRTAAEPLKNPRNAAAGALRNLDPAVTASRRLDACFYDVGYIEGRAFASQREMMDFLRENRFPTSGCEIYCPTLERAVEAVHQIEQSRGDLDYMIDGAVIKICDFATRGAPRLYGQVSALGGGVQV